MNWIYLPRSAISRGNPQWGRKRSSPSVLWLVNRISKMYCTKQCKISTFFAVIQLTILQSLKIAGIAGFDIKIFEAGRVAGAPAAAEIPRPRCVYQADFVSNGRSSCPSRFSGFSVGFRGSVRLGKSPTSFRVACKCRRRPTVPVPVPVGKQ